MNTFLPKSEKILLTVQIIWLGAPDGNAIGQTGFVLPGTPQHARSIAHQNLFCHKSRIIHALQSWRTIKWCVYLKSLFCGILIVESLAGFVFLSGGCRCSVRD